jgi:hypothetical protein
MLFDFFGLLRLGSNSLVNCALFVAALASTAHAVVRDELVRQIGERTVGASVGTMTSDNRWVAAYASARQVVARLTIVYI